MFNSLTALVYHPICNMSCVPIIRILQISLVLVLLIFIRTLLMFSKNSPYVFQYYMFQVIMIDSFDPRCVYKLNRIDHILFFYKVSPPKMCVC